MSGDGWVASARPSESTAPGDALMTPANDESGFPDGQGSDRMMDLPTVEEARLATSMSDELLRVRGLS